jgi:peptidoglycan hydrolase-like protein with peptidoglycan-binding domain
MRLKQLVIAIAAAFTASAFAAGDYSAPQRRSQGATPESAMSKSGGRQAQAQPSEVVKQVQQELKQQGFDAGPVDGQWGPLTQQGVKKFQESKNIRASGQLDEQTLSALGIQEQSSATGSSKAGGATGKGSGEAASGSGGINPRAGGSAGSSGPASGAGGGAESGRQLR